LAARSAALDRDLRRARPLDPSQIDASEVRVGTRLHLRAADGTTRTLTILGPWESRPEADVISYESDLAQRLLGKKTGDTADLDGREFTVETIETYA
jgi:transcription elongation GreA/GreB family factor